MQIRSTAELSRSTLRHTQVSRTSNLLVVSQFGLIIEMEKQIDETEKTAAGETFGTPSLQPREAIKYPKDKVPGSLSVDSDITKPKLDSLREKYSIPQTFELVIPSQDWKACSPPIGYGVVYRWQLEAGFRLLAHGFWAQLVNYYHLSLAQLTPSAIFLLFIFWLGA